MFVVFLLSRIGLQWMCRSTSAGAPVKACIECAMQQETMAGIIATSNSTVNDSYNQGYLLHSCNARIDDVVELVHNVRFDFLAVGLPLSPTGGSLPNW